MLPGLSYSTWHVVPTLTWPRLPEVWTGGGTCPEHVRDSFRAAHGPSLVTATYGLSEASDCRCDRPCWRRASRGSERAGAASPIRWRIRRQRGDASSRQHVGELAIGPATEGPWAGLWQPLLGRWEDGAVRKLESEVVMTGDVGWVDSEGWLTMVDRKKTHDRPGRGQRFA